MFTAIESSKRTRAATGTPTTAAGLGNEDNAAKSDGQTAHVGAGDEDSGAESEGEDEHTGTEDEDSAADSDGEATRAVTEDEDSAASPKFHNANGGGLEGEYSIGYCGTTPGHRAQPTRVHRLPSFGIWLE